jgi:hypothetical protein
MTEVPLEFHDVRQLKLWRRFVYNLYEKYVDVFDEYGGIEELIKLLNHLDELLNILSIKLPYDVKIAEFQKFLSDLDNFRIQCSRYIGRAADLLYKDVKEIIDEVFSGEVEEGDEDV